MACCCGPGWCILPCSLWGETQEYLSVSHLDMGLHHFVKDRGMGTGNGTLPRL